MTKKTDELMTALSELLEKDVGAKMKEDTIPLDEQMSILRSFVKQPIDFKVGDLVVLNEHGKARYKFPKGDDVAIIAEVFASLQFDEEKMTAHGAIARAVNVRSGNTVVMHPVDFRFYKKWVNPNG